MVWCVAGASRATHVIADVQDSARGIFMRNDSAEERAGSYSSSSFDFVDSRRAKPRGDSTILEREPFGVREFLPTEVTSRLQTPTMRLDRVPVVDERR